MKKTFSLLFVVFMMASMVTLVGCNGLWNFDDDDQASVLAPTPTIVLKSTVSMAGDPNLSLRAAVGDYSVLTARLYKRNTTAPVIASVTVNADGTYELKVQTSVVADYFVKVSNSSDSVTLYKYITVKPTVTAPSLDATNASSTAIGILIMKADKDGKVAAIDSIATNTADFITITGQVKAAWGKKGGVEAISPVVKVTNITLNKTSTTISLGGNETLTTTALPTYATELGVTWASDNTAVATVDPTTGKITANATTEGTAKITATAKDGSGIKATCDVTVSKVIVLVTSITLNKTELSLNTGANETLTVTGVLPANASDKTYVWASDNDSVATVDAAGKVTAKTTAGTANITATAKDASGVKGTCVVTVKVPAPITSVEFDKTVTGLNVADFQIHITGTGIDAAYDTKTTVAAGGSKEIAKSSSLSTATKVVLTFNGFAFDAITDFTTLTFTTAIPAGAKVEIKKNDGTLVATGK